MTLHVRPFRTRTSFEAVFHANSLRAAGPSQRPRLTMQCIVAMQLALAAAPAPADSGSLLRSRSALSSSFRSRFAVRPMLAS